MINLNKGMNDELLEKCKALSDYMFLVDLIRTYQKEMEFSQAVDRAVTECIEKNVLADFLTKHKAEVLDMCITEFNEKAFVDGIHQEGIQEERQRIIKENYAEGTSIFEISKFLKISESEVKEVLEIK